MSYYTCGTTPTDLSSLFPYSVFSEESPEKPVYSFVYKENAEDWCALMNFAHHTLRNQGFPSTSVGDVRLDKFVKWGSNHYEGGKAPWDKKEQPELPRGGFF